MNVLLDTHVFLWLEEDPRKLSADANALIAAADTKLWLSIASLWEIAIKQSLGKFPNEVTIGELVEVATIKDDMHLLPVEIRHITSLATLPTIHRDPFDRILIAQAMTDSFTLVTADAMIWRYPAVTLW